MQHFRFIVPVVFLSFLVLSCHKNTEEATDPASWIDPTPGTITGRWELYQTYSGMSPLTTHAPGNGIELHIGNTTYAYYRNGQVQQQGTYRVERDSVMNVQTCTLEAPKTSAPNRIIYDDDTRFRTGFTATKNSLSLSSGCIPADGGVSIYRKISAE